jgi:hypothetical protein
MRSACVGHLGLTLESIKYFAPLMLPHCCSRSLRTIHYTMQLTRFEQQEREKETSLAGHARNFSIRPVPLKNLGEGRILHSHRDPFLSACCK